MRTITQFKILSASALLFACSLMAVPQASASSPTLKLAFSSARIEIGQSTTATICGHDVKSRSAIALEEAFGTKVVWRQVYLETEPAGSRCVTHDVTETSLGEYSFRLALTLGGHRIVESNPARLYVYGPISIVEFADNVGLNCGTASVSAGGHLYQTFCEIREGNSLTSKSVSTCRSMTLDLVASDVDNDGSPDPSTGTFELEQSTLNEQSFTFPDLALTTQTLALDASKFEITFTDTSPHPYYDSVYFVDLGTADCYTPTGTL
jgi:hypothetical protein